MGPGVLLLLLLLPLLPLLLLLSLHARGDKGQHFTSFRTTYTIYPSTSTRTRRVTRNLGSTQPQSDTRRILIKQPFSPPTSKPVLSFLSSFLNKFQPFAGLLAKNQKNLLLGRKKEKGRETRAKGSYKDLFKLTPLLRYDCLSVSNLLISFTRRKASG